MYYVNPWLTFILIKWKKWKESASEAHVGSKPNDCFDLSRVAIIKPQYYIRSNNLNLQPKHADCLCCSCSHLCSLLHNSEGELNSPAPGKRNDLHEVVIISLCNSREVHWRTEEVCTLFFFLSCNSIQRYTSYPSVTFIIH